MSNINKISSDLLLKTVKEILEKADLNVMTPKIVRNELQIRLKVNDLSCRKREINAFIMDVINDINNNNNNNETNSNADNETNTNTNQTDGYLKSGSTLPSNSKTNSDSNHESDSSSDESICDEELARKLQKEEEIDAKQRVTRSNRSTNKKKTKINKSKKRKTDKSDNSYNEKSQKKAKNGYLKPCLLSPILADFLGENEMPRHEVVKRIWSYVKEKNLLDPKNKQFAICDNELLKIFDRKRIRLFGMMKHLTKHLQ